MTGCQPSPKQEFLRFSVAEIRRVRIAEYGRNKKIEQRKIPTAIADVSSFDKMQKVKTEVKNLVLYRNIATKYANGRYLENPPKVEQVRYFSRLCPNEN